MRRDCGVRADPSGALAHAPLAANAHIMDAADDLMKRSDRLDPRSERSRLALRKAMLALIEASGIGEISVREITSKARVSYPTFFNHYKSKEDLFLDVARQEITGLLAAFRDERLSPDWRPGEGVCAYVIERRALWRILLTAGTTEAMRSEFIRHARDLSSDQPPLGHGFPIDAVAGLVASGMFELIAWWLGQEPDYPVSEIADMLESLVIEPALHLRPGYFTSRRRLSILRADRP